MDDVITWISAWKNSSKLESESFKWSEEDLDKNKSGSSVETKLLENGSSVLIGDLSNKETEIYDSDISEILSYGKTNTKDSVSPWGYRSRIEKVWATGENWWL